MWDDFKLWNNSEKPYYLHICKEKYFTCARAHTHSYTPKEQKACVFLTLSEQQTRPTPNEIRLSREKHTQPQTSACTLLFLHALTQALCLCLPCSWIQPNQLQFRYLWSHRRWNHEYWKSRLNQTAYNIFEYLFSSVIIQTGYSPLYTTENESQVEYAGSLNKDRHYSKTFL